MRKYEKPMAYDIEITSQNIIASSLKYTEENADKNFEVLSNKNRGDWGNFWK